MHQAIKGVIKSNARTKVERGYVPQPDASYRRNPTNTWQGKIGRLINSYSDARYGNLPGENGGTLEAVMPIEDGRRPLPNSTIGAFALVLLAARSCTIKSSGEV